jgi:hypothetical protein
MTKEQVGFWSGRHSVMRRAWVTDKRKNVQQGHGRYCLAAQENVIRCPGKRLIANSNLILCWNPA